MKEAIINAIEKAGSDHLGLFGGKYIGGYHIQQDPEELAEFGPSSICSINICSKRIVFVQSPTFIGLLFTVIPAFIHLPKNTNGVT